ncbi:MAG: nicotinate-nucleotide adenylyltransferase [Gammaproteobacteria bacterium]
MTPDPLFPKLPKRSIERVEDNDAENNKPAEDRTELIGVLGGAFDPIHIGHLRMALEIQSQLSATRILFLPTPTPPHKSTVYATYADRLNMLKLALAQHEGLAVSEIENALPKPNYTVNTLRALRVTLPQHQRLCWIMGLDSLHQLTSWYRWETLFSLSHIIVVNRPITSALPKALSSVLVDRWCDNAIPLHTQSTGKIIKLETPKLDIASRQLRHMVQTKQALDYLVPAAVIDYIKEHRLYL